MTKSRKISAALLKDVFLWKCANIAICKYIVYKYIGVIYEKVVSDNGVAQLMGLPHIPKSNASWVNFGPTRRNGTMVPTWG